jgi:hypothetical protein
MQNIFSIYSAAACGEIPNFFLIQLNRALTTILGWRSVIKATKKALCLRLLQTS